MAMLKTAAVVGGAMAVIALAWAIHPGLGLLVGMLSLGAVEGLLSK